MRVVVAGLRASALIDMIKKFIRSGLVPDSEYKEPLSEALGRAKGLMMKRDEVVHSTWMFTNDTPVGHVSSLRSRATGIEPNVWHPDDLETLRQELEDAMDDLSTLGWNAMTPTSGQNPFPWPRT